LSLPELSAGIFGIAPGWPKRMDDLPFTDDGGDIRWMQTADAFFAWLGELATVQWAGGMGHDGTQLTPKAEVFAHVRFRAERVDAVEVLPHEPVMDGVYYAWRKPDYVPDGKYLQGLIDFFPNAEKPIDRILIRAMFMTPCWGGLPGTRPAFAVIADDRGSGKSCLTDALCNLYGHVELEPTVKGEERIISRLLTPESLTKRIVRMDNVKSLTSSALLESLITARVISGHRLYSGEAQRRNTLTWVITGNGMRLSRDLADRAFIIRLTKPELTPGWEDSLTDYIRRYRDLILSDIIARLKAAPVAHSGRDRWQAWTDGLLARAVPEDGPNTAAAVIKANQTRRNECDDDLEEAVVIRDAIFAALDAAIEANRAKPAPFETRLGKDEDTECFFVSTSDVTPIIREALSVNWTTKTVSMVLKSHCAAKHIDGIEFVRERTARGFIVSRKNV